MGISVPNTNTFSLSDVHAAVNDHTPTSGNLANCFANANPDFFDPAYNADGYAPANSLLRFRNYTPSVAPILFTLNLQAKKLVNPTITYTNYKTAVSLNGVYIDSGVRYHPNYNVNYNVTSGPGQTIKLMSDPDISTVFLNLMQASPYRSVWVDSDGNGVKDSLTAGAQLTVSKTISVSSQKTILVGIIGDNKFQMSIDGTIVLAANTIDSNNFRYLNIFPVTIEAGQHILSFTGTGDGTVNDALGVIIWDNTIADILAPVPRTSWNVLFSTEDTLNQTLDIVTCPVDYSYDSGENMCVQITSAGNMASGDTAIITPSYPSGETVTSWNIAYGDGGTSSGSGTPPSIFEHVYASPGLFEISITLNLTSGGTATGTYQLTVS